MSGYHICPGCGHVWEPAATPLRCPGCGGTLLLPHITVTSLERARELAATVVKVVKVVEE